MLKQGIKNVICMNGVKLPETIKELSREKEITLFVDGDRGGKLIIKNVTDNASIAYIAMAPEGKEVEELTSKEILQALRRRITLKEYTESDEKTRRSRFTSDKSNNDEPEASKREIKKMADAEIKIVKEHLDELIGTKAAILFNKNMQVIKKMPLSRLGYFRPEEEVYVLAINDTALPGIIRAAESMGVQNLAAKNFTTTNTAINLVSV